MNNALWVWLDLEMTGLEEHDTILEIGCILTNPQLQIVSSKPFHKVIHHTKSQLDQMSEWCINHHQASGLTNDVLMSKDNLASSEKLLIEFIVNHSINSDVIYLAGNSIHTDRVFVRRLMPALESLLHYRMIDVTAISLFLETIDMKGFEKKSSHRACDDIVESIEELRYYKQKILGHQAL